MAEPSRISFGFVLKFYGQSWKSHIRSIVEYPGEFWIMALSGSIWMILQFVFLSVLFSRIPSVSGWEYHEMLMLSAFLAIAAAAPALLADGIWGIGSMVIKGDLDYRIVRPAPMIVQVATAQVGVQSLGEIFIASVMLAVGWIGSGLDPLLVPIGLGMLVCAIVIELSLIIVLCSLNFWVKGPMSIFAIMVVDLQNKAMRMPLPIFPGGVRTFATFILPVAFVNYVPIAILTEREPLWWVAFSPVVALIVAGLAAFAFRQGMKCYNSAGN